MKHSKQFLIFGILAGGILGLIASSPTIYAIVEPHITINMDPGQTTNPFQINDDLGSEVFSIDPNGAITSSGAPIQLVYEADGPIDVTSTFPDSTFLAKWEITKPAGALDNAIAFTEHIMSSEIKRTAGTSFVFVALEISPDDVSYNIEDSIESDSDTNEPVFGISSQTAENGNTRFIAITTLTDDVPTTGEIRNVKMFFEIVLPQGWTIERVL